MSAGPAGVRAGVNGATRAGANGHDAHGAGPNGSDAHGPAGPAGRPGSGAGGYVRPGYPAGGRRRATAPDDVEATTPHPITRGARRPSGDRPAGDPGRATGARTPAGRASEPGRAGAGSGAETADGTRSRATGRTGADADREEALPGRGTAAALVARARGGAGQDRAGQDRAGQDRASKAAQDRDDRAGTDAATPAAGRAARRRQAPTDEGLRRWLEPANYAALLPVVTERASAFRARRRAKLAGKGRCELAWYYGRLAGFGALVLFVVLPAVMFTLGFLFLDVPTPDDAVNKQVATISYSDSSELARIVPEQGNRTKVSIDQVPERVQLAVLSAEDRSFFSNPGFDPMGIARAAWRQLTGGSGGGSTITQQYVKKTLVGDEHSLWRKFREMVIAVKISQQSSKKEILADYLNAIYFGRGAYGIQSASQAYFGKDVSQLTVAEGALLAGVIQSPSRWDPAVNPQRASVRWSFVMDGMVTQGWLPAAERAQARFPTTQSRPKSAGSIPSDYRGLILSAIKDELEQKGISEQEFNQEGLKITTTIDPAAQQRAVDSARKALIGQPPNLRGALVSVDPNTGGITAYYGGDNGVGLDYARVSKQPGSTFKPFVLLAALLQSDPIGLGTKFRGEALPGLRNSDGADCAVCDIKQAMTVSNNVIFHELAMRVGPQRVADAARQAGITSPLTNPDDRIALGNKEITPVELAAAYATFASGGVYHAPHLVTKVTTSDDRVIYEAVPSEERRFSPQVARNVTEAMLGVPVHDKLNLTGGRVSAAKTGTVQSRFEGENNDAWIAGYTPGLATAVWIGTDQNTPIRTSKGTPITGASMPGSIWKTYMNEAVKTDDDDADSDAKDSFGSFKAIGAPPAATGLSDGYAAGPATSSTPATSAAPPPSYSPGFPASGAPLPPDEQDGRSSTGRDCGLLGCKTVPEPGSASSGDNSDERQAPEDDEDRSDAVPKGSSGSAPPTRAPVRG